MRQCPRTSSAGARLFRVLSHGAVRGRRKAAALGAVRCWGVLLLAPFVVEEKTPSGLIGNSDKPQSVRVEPDGSASGLMALRGLRDERTARVVARST